MARRVERKQSTNPKPTGKAIRPSGDQHNFLQTPSNVIDPRPPAFRDTLITPFESGLQVFNHAHIGDFKNLLSAGKQTTADLLKLHADLGQYKKEPAKTDAENLQTQIKQRFSDSPNKHLDNIKNNRAALLQYFQLFPEESSGWWFLGSKPEPSQAFSNCSNIEILKTIKKTLNFSDTEAVKAVKTRIKELETKPSSYPSPKEANILQRAWAGWKDSKATSSTPKNSWRIGRLFRAAFGDWF